VHRSIVQTYQDDFARYSRKASLQRLHRVFESAPRAIGEKVKYSRISREDRNTEVKSAIELLIKARVFTPTFHCDCSGLPLRAGMDEKIYKLYFLDVGILNYMNGVDWKTIDSLDERRLIHEGKQREQFIAQHLAYIDGGEEPPALYYWLREGKINNAEVDFVIAASNHIVPIEVKSGKSGSLKSLQQFLGQKKTPIAVRFDLNLSTRQAIGSSTLLSLPLYLVEEILHYLMAYRSQMR
jgi:predicted AAA+ superfamily ATPase